MLSKRFNRNSGALRLVCIACAAITGLLIVADIRLRPMLYEFAQSEAKRYALQIINSAVADTLRENSFDFDTIVKYETDQEGRITTLSTNAAAVDRITTDIFSRAHKTINNSDRVACKVNIGTLTKSALLYGKGPAFTVRVQISRYINYELISGFTEAGINQTKNSLYLKLTASIYTVMPGDKRTETVSTKILLAETVIVGEVPEAFTEVIQVGSSEFDTADTLVNFGQ